MSEILDLKAVKDGDNISECIVYIESYRKLPKKDGKSFYIAGNFVKQEDSLSFKVWDSTLVEAMSQNDFSGSVVSISGQASTYMNNLDLKINSITSVDSSTYPKSLFLKSADVNSLFKEFSDFINTELSQKGITLIQAIFKAENIMSRFKEEFAGAKMHDAQVGGLLNHTLKMLRIAKCVYSNENRMSKLEDYKDLLYLSVILHDIGKVYEMNLGVYQEHSYVTHRILGTEILVKYKKGIVELFDEDFYYQLVSVVVGHHGKDFGDAPTTVIAFIIHLIDMLDSQVTGIFDRIERNEITVRAGNTSVLVDGSYLVV